MRAVMEIKDLQCEADLRRPAGRPRSEVARKAILDSAFSFLKEKPLAEISTIHIAHKAAVSTATVYRWWTTKEALLLDAFLAKADPAVTLSSEGTPLNRLRNYVFQIGSFFAGESGIVVARVLTAIQDNATLRKEFIERIYSPRSKESRDLVEQAIAEGQLPAATDVGFFLDCLFGPLLTRLLIRHEPIDQSFVAAVFDQVVAGAKAAPAR
jgi:AcrR family transcriptional regulator